MTRDHMGKSEFQTEARAALKDAIDRCPICAVPFKPEDLCADDVTEGTCHAACLEGSPVVDLDTGDELPDGKADTYLYRDVMAPPPEPHLRGSDLTYKVHPNIVFNAACGINPYLFSTIPSEAHRAASPMTVEAAREKALAVAARAIDAAMEAAWLPIEQADRSITNVQSFEEVGITLRNSARYWVRDEEGRTFEASWTEGENGRNYWWDWEAESPVDPVEFMPHPLDPRFAAISEGLDNG